jgi:hypothetical protein
MTERERQLRVYLVECIEQIRYGTPTALEMDPVDFDEFICICRSIGAMAPADLVGVIDLIDAGESYTDIAETFHLRQVDEASSVSS